MNNHVFYKTSIPEQDRDYTLVYFLEKQLEEITQQLQSLDSQLCDQVLLHEETTRHGFIGRFRHFEPPMVILRDKPENETYGHLTVRELIEKLLRLREETQSGYVREAIEVILSSLTKVSYHDELSDDDKERINGILMEILGSTYRGEIEPWEVEEIRKLLTLLADVQHTCLVYGRYIADLNLIVLYYDSIRKSESRYGNSRFSLFSMVLAHEMFHAYHCSVIGEDRFTYTGGRTRRQKTQNKQLTEALADYYAVHYLITLYNRNGQSDVLHEAEHRYTAWKKNLFWSWPYSRALYFFTPDPFGHTRRLIELPDRIEEHLDEYDRSFEKFIKVFLTVADDNREKAYRILIEK